MQHLERVPKRLLSKAEVVERTLGVGERGVEGKAVREESQVVGGDVVFGVVQGCEDVRLAGE